MSFGHAIHLGKALPCAICHGPLEVLRLPSGEVGEDGLVGCPSCNAVFGPKGMSSVTILNGYHQLFGARFTDYQKDN